MYYKNLSHIATIQSGLVLSRKEARMDTEQCVEYRNLNLRSVNGDGGICLDSLDQYFAVEKLDRQFITQKNDIVLRLFSPYHPALITEHLEGFVVPSQFAIVRLTCSDVIPEYLHAFLFRRKMLESLALRESGQVASGIKISALSDIAIPLIALDKQKAIAAYSELNTKNKQHYVELMRQYEQKLDAVIDKVIGGL